VQVVNEQLHDRDEFLQQIKERLLLAHDIIKAQHDKMCHPMEFNEGEWVWLWLHHRSADGITSLQPNKLSPQFYRPYQILEHIETVVHQLVLPTKAKIHDVFHVALLKKFEGNPLSEITPLPPIQHGRVIPTPEKVIRARLNKGNWEALVSWQGQSSTDATWEKVTNFKLTYHEVQLEDKLFLEAGNVVDSFIGKVYQRRHLARKEQDADLS
jgi:hypothetical protein